jgi:hypothetical protein
VSRLVRRALDQRHRRHAVLHRHPGDVRDHDFEMGSSMSRFPSSEYRGVELLRLRDLAFSCREQGRVADAFLQAWLFSS